MTCLAILSAAVASPALSSSCDPPFSDDFSSGSLAPRWVDITTGGAGSAAVTGGELVLTKADGVVGATIVSLDNSEVICGDFDIAVDYRFINFPGPTAGGGRFQALTVVDASDGSLLAGAERYREPANSCIPTSDAYKFYSTVPGCTPTALYVSTSDTQGRFRLVRIGTTVRAYYWAGGTWVEALSRSITTVPVSIHLYTGTNGSLTPGDQVAFDNLTVQQPGSAPDPGQCVGNFSDDFSAGTLAPRWKIESSGFGSATETGGELVLSKSSGGVGSVSVTLDNSKVICGDFDLWADYRFVDFPLAVTGGGKFQAMTVGDATTGAVLAGVERYRENVNACIPVSDAYKLYSNVPNCPPDAIYISTSDTQGKFRIVRSGSTVHGYYWSGGTWVEGLTRSIPTTPIALHLYTGTNGAITTGQQVAFDNLNLIQGVVSVAEAGATPFELALAPSPAHGGALLVRFSLPSNAPARVDLLDIAGRRVLTREIVAPGPGPASTDLAEGRRIAPGMYFLRLRQGTLVATRIACVLQ
jgi:hypothetical protein